MSLVEILVAVSILAIGFLPILTVSSQGVERARSERATAVATWLSSNTLSRFASLRGDLESYLTPSAEPGVRELRDALAIPELAELLGASGVADIVRAHEMKVALVLKPSPVPGGQLLYSKATWIAQRGNKRKPERVIFTRLLVYDN